MNILESLKVTLIVTCLSLMLVACGAAEEPAPVAEAPTATSQPLTATPRPPTDTPEPPTATPLAPADTWETFVSEEFGFSVLLPDTPVESTQPIEADGQTTDMTLFTVEGVSPEGQNYAYIVSHMPFPEIVRNADESTIETLLDNTRDGVISSVDGTIISEQSRNLNDYPGRQIELRADELRLITWFVLADTRLYQVAVSIDEAAEFSANDLVFLDSFTVLESPAPTADTEPSTLTESDPAPAGEWQAFTAPDNSFAVLLPSTPDEMSQPVPGQDLSLKMYSAIDLNTQALYLVMYNDFPGNFLEGATKQMIEGALDLGRDSGLANIDGVLLNEESITLAGYPGREIIFEIPDSRIPGGGKGVAQFYLVDNRLYQLLVMGGKDSLPEADVDQFLNSFELLAE